MGKDNMKNLPSWIEAYERKHPGSVLIQNNGIKLPNIKHPKEGVSTASMPNKTELRAKDILRLPEDACFEGRSFKLENHTYTPDWICPVNMIAVEVKGEYIHSRDSRIMFDMARKLYPSYMWIWARNRTSGRKGRRWDVEIY